MKKIPCFLCCLLSGFLAPAQTPVVLNVRDATGAPFNLNAVFIPASLNGIAYPNLVYGTNINVSPVNGVLSNSLLEGPYHITFRGSPKTLNVFVPGDWVTNFGFTLPLNLADPRWQLSGATFTLVVSNGAGGGAGVDQGVTNFILASARAAATGSTNYAMTVSNSLRGFIATNPVAASNLTGVLIVNISGDIAATTNYQGSNVVGTIPALPLTNALILDQITAGTNATLAALAAGTNAALAGAQATLNATNALLVAGLTAGTNATLAALTAGTNAMLAALTAGTNATLAALANGTNAALAGAQATLNATNALLVADITVASNQNTSALIATNALRLADAISTSNLITTALVASNAQTLAALTAGTNATLAALAAGTNAALAGAQATLNATNALLVADITVASNQNTSALIATNALRLADAISTSNLITAALVASNAQTLAALTAGTNATLAALAAGTNAALAGAQATLNATNALLVADITVASNQNTSALIATNALRLADAISTSNLITAALVASNAQTLAALTAGTNATLAALVAGTNAALAGAQATLNATNALLVADITVASNQNTSALIATNALAQATLVSTNTAILATATNLTAAERAALIATNLILVASIGSGPVSQAQLVAGTNAAVGFAASASNANYFRAQWIQGQVGCLTNSIVASGSGTLADGTNLWAGNGSFTNISGSSYLTNDATGAFSVVSGSRFQGFLGGWLVGSTTTNINAGGSPLATRFIPLPSIAVTATNWSGNYGTLGKIFALDDSGAIGTLQLGYPLNADLPNNDRNMAINDGALQAFQTGSGNSAAGFQSLNNLLVGDDNTAIGDTALINLITGTRNIAIGFEAGYMLTNGNDNIYIGFTTGIMGKNETANIYLGAPNIHSNSFIAGLVHVRDLAVTNSIQVLAGQITGHPFGIIPVIGISNAPPGWLVTNGFQVWLSLQTNSIPGPAWTNLPNGSLCTTTNGGRYTLSNLTWWPF